MFIPELVRYHKLRKLIDEVFLVENLEYNLSNLYKAQFKEDWVGRRYAVLNPYIHGEESSRILEYTENGVTDESYINKWCMDRMFAASEFIKNKSLLDMLGYNLEKLDNYGNYLFVLYPITFEELKKSFKRFCWFLPVIIAVVIFLAKVL